MKIQIHDLSENGEVVVRGVYGQKTIKRQLEMINRAIQNINADLRRVINEQN